MGGGEVHLLIVDDDADWRESLAEALAAQGHHVVAVGDGYEAIERFELSDGDFSAVILDVGLPELGGETTMATLRRLAADVPVIMVSGLTLSDGDVTRHRASADAFLSKPFSTSTLLDVIGRQSPG
jgi:DNA-binding response OmpR family regulator